MSDPSAPRSSGGLRAALGSAVIGAASGGAVLCLALLAYRPDPADPTANAAPVLAAGLGGLAAGAIVAWSLARNVGDVWRRTSVAMMGLMGAALLGALTMPVHRSAGTAGLLLLFAVCLAIMAAAWRLLLARAR